MVHEINGLGLRGVGRIVEPGCGPGVGLQEALCAFPTARIWGVVDHSPATCATAGGHLETGGPDQAIDPDSLVWERVQRPCSGPPSW